MTDKIKPLPDTIDELKALVLQLENKYNRLLEQFRLAQHQRFGKSSESDSTQFDLFNETEEEIIIENDDTQTITYIRQKPRRQRLPEDLPRTVIIHDIKDKTCKCCGLEMHAMGKDIRLLYLSLIESQSQKKDSSPVGKTIQWDSSLAVTS